MALACTTLVMPPESVARTSTSAQADNQLTFQLEPAACRWFCRLNVVRGVELLNDAAAGLLNQTGRRGLAGFVEVRQHRGRTFLDHGLIEHALGSYSGWSCKSNQGSSRIEQGRAHRASIALAALPGPEQQSSIIPAQRMTAYHASRIMLSGRYYATKLTPHRRVLGAGS